MNNEIQSQIEVGTSVNLPNCCYKLPDSLAIIPTFVAVIGGFVSFVGSREDAWAYFARQLAA